MVSSNPSVQRLFFALWPDGVLRDQLATLNRQLPLTTGKPVAPENLHITLQFLGSITDAQYERLLPTIPTCVVPPFTLRLDHLGLFPKSQVLWLGARETPPELRDLVLCLGDAMRGCGLEPDTRPYRAHLTLRRKVKKPLVNFNCDILDWPVSSFVLVRSQTLPDGPRYEILHQW